MKINRVKFAQDLFLHKNTLERERLSTYPSRELAEELDMSHVAICRAFKGTSVNTVNMAILCNWMGKKVDDYIIK